ETAALQIDHLEIQEGEFCLVIGQSGSGKTTLLRLLNGLIPHFTGGIVSGEIKVAGTNPVKAGPQIMSQEVGFVFQEVENQFVVDRVEDEIAFSLEQAGIPRAEMRKRVASILQQLNLDHLKNRQVDSLSGGETQRIAIAAALVLEPKILVLDEPTSQLDPLAAEEVMQLLKKLQREQGLTIVLSEQRLDRVLGYADSLFLLSPEGHLLAHGKPEEVIIKSTLKPPVVVLAERKKWSPLPLNVNQAKKFVHPTMAQAREIATIPNVQPPILKVLALEVSLGKRKILSDINLELFEHERLVLMGPNGAGKSTLLRSLVGLVEPDQGEVFIKGRKVIFQRTAELSKEIGFLPQDPNALLFAETVQKELETTLNNHQIPIQKDQIDQLLSQLNLSGKLLTYPRDLSTGEKQRVALGAVVVTQPDIIILDEPTRGLDQQTKNALLTLLHQWNQNGKTILLVTHDVEFAAGFASRVVILENGQIINDGIPETVLRSHPRYTPQIAQLYPHTSWLTIDDMPDE
ncbi:MAG TPA: energy-coupling factor transporter ATPase, partial [Anaerolineaceae bacterium]|nr:energy-coupling factor transporter ATPase [Anaerolineaceae bacterium]